MAKIALLTSFSGENEVYAPNVIIISFYTLKRCDPSIHFNIFGNCTFGIGKNEVSASNIIIISFYTLKLMCSVHNTKFIPPTLEK